MVSSQVKLLIYLLGFWWYLKVTQPGIRLLYVSNVLVIHEMLLPKGSTSNYTLQPVLP